MQEEAHALSTRVRSHHASPQRVALAWLLSLSPALIPIPGASRPESIRDSASAAELALDERDLALLGSIAARGTGSQ